jgi:hypothetical protein
MAEKDIGGDLLQKGKLLNRTYHFVSQASACNYQLSIKSGKRGGHEAKANISWEKSLIFGKTRQTRIHLSLPP